jgi:hypothetical protein
MPSSVAHPFTLHPFQHNKQTPPIHVTGEISRQFNILALRYEVEGDLSQLVIPQAFVEPKRRYCLWETTCFEWFMSPQGAEHYWEFNLSSNGDWNVYTLDGYRQGLREELAIRTLPFKVGAHSDRLQLGLTLDLSALVPAEQPIEIAITTVIETQAHGCSYWALTHLGDQADFHKRDSFLIQL